MRSSLLKPFNYKYHLGGQHAGKALGCNFRKLKPCTLIFPILMIWLALFLLISISNSNRPNKTSSSNHLHRLNAVASVTNRKEPLEMYLERTDTCDQLLEENFNETHFNTSVIGFCRRFLKAREEFYRARPQPVDVFDFKFLKDAADICSNEVDMIVLIHSLHTHRARRDAIRDTWGRAAKSRSWPHVGDSTLQPNVQIVFVFGVHEKNSEEQLLKEENEQHKDVIQGNFVESYRNMTLKSLFGLHWMSTYCPSAKYLFKCDDDMFINIPAIWLALENTNMTRSIMGPLSLGSRVYRTGKWKVTFDQFPFSFYPPYESGSGYAISSDLILPLYNISQYVPKIFIDDVYITGILGKILRVNHVRHGGFAFWTSTTPKSCDILNGTVLTGTRVVPQAQYSIWESLKSKAECETMQVLTLTSLAGRKLF